MKEPTDISESGGGSCIDVSCDGVRRQMYFCVCASAAFFLAGLLVCLFYAVCHITGRVFYLHYSLLLFQQCLPAVLFGAAGGLFYLAGGRFCLWGATLLVAGLLPSLSWLLQASGSLYLEANGWGLVLALPFMLNAYLEYLSFWAERLEFPESGLRRFLAAQNRMVLYIAVVPFGAFAGSCLISRGLVFRGLLQQIFGGEYWVVSRYLVSIIGINLLVPAIDSVWFLYESMKNRPRQTKE